MTKEIINIDTGELSVMSMKAPIDFMNTETKNHSYAQEQYRINIVNNMKKLNKKQ